MTNKKKESLLAKERPINVKNIGVASKMLGKYLLMLAALIFFASIASADKLSCQDLSIVSEIVKQSPIEFRLPVLAANSKRGQLSCWMKTLQQIDNANVISWKKFRNLDKSTSLILIAFTIQDLQEALDVIASNRLGTGNSILIMAHFTDTLKNEIVSGITIDQSVYIAKRTSNGSSAILEIVETYSVNQQNIRHIVGQFDTGKSKFIVNPGWNPSLRNNFQGANLVALSQNLPPYTYLTPDYPSKSKFYENNQTYDVTDLLKQGLYLDVMRELASDLNFTFRAYKRKDNIWGTLIDGKPAGILSNLADGSADLVMASYGMNLIRFPYCKHVRIITSFLPTIAIKGEQSEQYSLDTFTYPFTTNLWLAMSATSVGIATWLFMTNNVSADSKTSDKVQSWFAWTWTAFAANVGGGPDMDLTNNTLSNRIVMFVLFLGGVVLWMGYQATLTSILATNVKSLPFNSLETLLETNYRLATFIQGSTQADLFIASKEGTISNKLFMEKMQSDDSFVSNAEGLNNVLTEDNYAFLNYDQMLLADRNFDCKITIAWKSRIPPLYASFATPRNSSYNKILSQQLNKIIETGRFNTIAVKHLRKEPNCEPLLQEATPLSFKKLVTLFMIALGGGLLALALLGMELIVPISSKDDSEIYPDLVDPEVREAFRLIRRKRKFNQLQLDMTLDEAIDKFGS